MTIEDVSDGLLMHTVLASQVGEGMLKCQGCYAIDKAIGCPVIIINPVQRMQERRAAILASPALPVQVYAGDLVMVRQIHDVLLQRAMGIEDDRTARSTTDRAAFTVGVDAEQVFYVFRSFHSDSRQVDG